MILILVGASFFLVLIALANGNWVEFGDPTFYLIYCLAYGFAPAAAGYAVAIINRLTGRRRTGADYNADRNWGWFIFILIFGAGQIVQGAKS
jgi:hypothetical protein